MTWEPDKPLFISRIVFIERDVQGQMDSLGFCAFCFVQKMNLTLVDKLPVLDVVHALSVSLSNIAMILVFLLILVNTIVHHRRSAKPRELLRRQRSLRRKMLFIYLKCRAWTKFSAEMILSPAGVSIVKEQVKQVKQQCLFFRRPIALHRFEISSKR